MIDYTNPYSPTNPNYQYFMDGLKDNVTIEGFIFFLVGVFVLYRIFKHLDKSWPK
jgi:hypothetical protein